ncbi:hypothetical protein BDV96DRAFT_648240 [Lophiotrema nucula]|uniref:Uncharacterized protein n=1 Tax=Lophiotrema nucula TaxID=690887 RepID=A0A6A5Z2N4_9PLEO|nr:hypothetical protein BDV96DRAFT_648240 [Lophiotrema nucula]
MSDHLLHQVKLLRRNMQNEGDDGDLGEDTASDLSGADSDNGGYEPPFDDVASMEGKSITKHTGLTPMYVPHWTNQDAFREFYQNWKDSIRAAYGVGLRDFRPVTSERPVTKKQLGEHLTQVFHPRRGELMGYIRFKYNENNEGILEMTNFGANLQLWHISMGGTNKRNNEDLAGEHGDGLKSSMNHLRRFPQNYPCHMESSSARWTWFFNQGNELDCKVFKLPPDEIQKRKEATEGKPRTTEARIWEDTSIFVGGRGKKLPLWEFRNMLKVTIDLELPAGIFQTPYGDLILDQALAQNIYLKPLLLGSGQIGGKTLTYAYNLLKGQTNRDRQAISLSDVGPKITAIWDEVLKTGGSDVINAYTDLLLTKLNQTADVMPKDGKLSLSRNSTRKIWIRMGETNKDHDGRLPFYFVAGPGSNDAHIIRYHLNRNPVAIDRVLWNILRKQVKCLTVEEERQNRFEDAQPVQVQDTQFARHVDWILRCLTQSHPATQTIEHTFVEADGLGLEMVLSGNKWRIDQKWQDFTRAHDHGFHSGCENAEPTPSDLFSCDHVAEWLWETGISHAIGGDPRSEIAINGDTLKGMSRFKLRQMPRGVSCVQTERRGELAVH